MGMALDPGAVDDLKQLTRSRAGRDWLQVEKALARWLRKKQPDGEDALALLEELRAREGVLVRELVLVLTAELEAGGVTDFRAVVETAQGWPARRLAVWLIGG